MASREPAPLRLLGSMGTTGGCFDNSLAEAFFSGLQRELLCQRRWDTRDQLAVAMIDGTSSPSSPSGAMLRPVLDGIDTVLACPQP